MKLSAPRREADYDPEATREVVGTAWVLPAPNKWTVFMYLVIWNILDILGMVEPVTLALWIQAGSGHKLSLA